MTLSFCKTELLSLIFLLETQIFPVLAGVEITTKCLAKMVAIWKKENVGTFSQRFYLQES